MKIQVKGINLLNDIRIIIGGYIITIFKAFKLTDMCCYRKQHICAYLFPENLSTILYKKEKKG